ncbi:protein O-mannosyl-transferase family [Leptospira andrefontaineae]|uniref:DUF2723 domain-containing protein n=1 Tax=Leptospira andrefontaineae TaxID=2484976 RepID=A0A4R9HCX8_9LEPT|nr:DUF2723 domain-containing protein [Leptospira andrefontaineae]TGK44687.1 DUF2723 domain-containing protein [Leptospira andrefontaineae]
MKSAVDSIGYLFEKNTDRSVSILLFLFFLISYSYIAPSHVTFEDSGSFLLVALNAGIAHPPGYPLYSLLGKIVSSLIFWGSPAFQVHFMNCLLGAGTATLLYLFVRRWKYSLDSSLLAAVLFGSAFTVVYQSVVAEVYILNSFLFLLSWFYLIKFEESKIKTHILLFGLFSGLSMSCHWPLAVLSSFSFLPILWSERKKVFEYKYFLIFGFLLGLTPYLYFFVAHYFTDFLFLGPIRSLGDFFYVLLRKDREDSNVFSTATFKDSVEFIVGFISFSAEDLVYFGLFISLVGFILSFVLIGRLRSVSLFLALLSNSVFLLFLWRAEWNALTKDLYRFYNITPLLALCIYFAIGWDFFLKYISSSLYKRSFSILILIFILGFFFYKTIWKVQQSTDKFAYSYAKEVLSELPAKSSLLVHSDMDAPEIAYAHYGENFRPDLELNSQLAAMLPRKIFDRRFNNTNESRRIPLLNYISHRLDKGIKVFTTKKIVAFDDKTAPFPLSYSYRGLVYEISNTPQPDGISEKTYRFAISELDREILTFKDRKIWSYYRNQIVGEYCKIVVEARMYHTAFEYIPVCILMAAQSLNAYEKKFPESDEYFLKVIPYLKDLYVSEQADIVRQFLINRVHWVNSGMDNRRMEILMKEGIQIAIPIASRMKKCDHPLLYTMEEIDRQLSLGLSKSLTETRQKVCSK